MKFESQRGEKNREMDEGYGLGRWKRTERMIDRSYEEEQIVGKMAG